MPIYSNTGDILKTAQKIRQAVPKQMVRAVKWESSMCTLFTAGPNDLLPSVYECGPGKTLSTMLEKLNGRTARNSSYISV